MPEGVVGKGDHPRRVDSYTRNRVSGLKSQLHHVLNRDGNALFLAGPGHQAGGHKVSLRPVPAWPGLSRALSAVRYANMTRVPLSPMIDRSTPRHWALDTMFQFVYLYLSSGTD